MDVIGPRVLRWWTTKTEGAGGNDDPAATPVIARAIVAVAQAADVVPRQVDASGEVVARTDRHDAQDGTPVIGDLHESVHHFVDGTIPAHCNDHVIPFCLFCKVNGVTGVNRTAPIDATMLLRNGTQVAGRAPGVAHICHGIQDDLDLSVHNSSSNGMSP